MLSPQLVVGYHYETDTSSNYSNYLNDVNLEVAQYKAVGQ